MARKSAASKPTERFVVINLDCNNVEHVAFTMEEATSYIEDNIHPNGEEWDVDDLRILQVTAIHKVAASKVTATVTEISNIDYAL